MKDTVPPINVEEARAVGEGVHPDPYAVLGRHDGWIAAFDPGAEEMAALVGGEAHDLHRIGGTNVFAGRAPEGPYTLRGRAHGGEWEADDPFRFGPVLGEIDEYLLGEGTHQRLWKALGAHVIGHEGARGTHFAVWAPNARRVAVVGDFNWWDGRRLPMRPRGGTGVWEAFVPGLGEGALYRYEITGPDGAVQPLKADPVGFGSEHPPKTASVVRDLEGYGWKDGEWMEGRVARNRRDAPISVYEVHLGSWRRRDDGRPISYREAADELVEYARWMGFTHIELLPVSEHPFDGSWGYQPVGLYAPTIRFGPPNEFRDLVDAAHRAGLGVLLDWVPGHFPADEHGLARFDGTRLYEHADPKEGFHQDWNTLIYNYGRVEVANYLSANALYWLEEYHVDGLRVDAVASMLYRDYSRKEGEWIPNEDGGRENYEAIALLQRMNAAVYGNVEGIMTVAEESTSYPGVSAPVDAGGLGFGYKWNMGWMNDTLRFMEKAPEHRKWHHNLMTFGLHYAFSENFVLPISHDEVVHGKGSMLGKMPGEEWQRFANLRAYYGFMWGHPGKKLLFMGQEFAQPGEWDHDGTLPWHLSTVGMHEGVREWVRDLNRVYAGTPALHVFDAEPAGFEWVVGDDIANSTFVWLRRGHHGDAPVLVACNFTPVERPNYRVGLPLGGRWSEVLNSDSERYGGSGKGNIGGVEAREGASHGQPFHAEIFVPPLATVMLRHEG